MRHRRFRPLRWWSTSRRSGHLVIAVLVVIFVGANTSDDGYILTMAGVEHAGYMCYTAGSAPEACFRLVRPAGAVGSCRHGQYLDAPATLAMALTCYCG